MNSDFPKTSNQIYSLVERQNSSRLIRILFSKASREFVFRIRFCRKIPSDYPSPTHGSQPGRYTFAHTFFISFRVVAEHFFVAQFYISLVTVFDFRFLFTSHSENISNLSNFPLEKIPFRVAQFFLDTDPEYKVSKASNAMLLTRQIIDAVRTNYDDDDGRRK